MWFKRVLWAYYPISWQGWVVLLLLAASFSAVQITVRFLIEKLHFRISEDVAYLSIPVIVLTGLFIAHRHSR